MNIDTLDDNGLSLNGRLGVIVDLAPCGAFEGVPLHPLHSERRIIWHKEDLRVLIFCVKSLGEEFSTIRERASVLMGCCAGERRRCYAAGYRGLNLLLRRVKPSLILGTAGSARLRAWSGERNV